MKAILAAALLLFSSATHAATIATVTPGPWDLYKGSTIIKPRVLYTSEAACAEAARLRGLVANYLCKTASSVAVTIVVDPPPVVNPVAIVTQPSSLTVVEGAPVLLAVGATGGGVLTYQWYKDGAPVGLGGGLIPAGPTYGLTISSLTDAGTYTVVVRNSVSSVTSAPAVVVVTAKPPPPPPPGGSALLTWTAPDWKANGTDPADVVGYVIRYGQQPGSYSASVAAPASPATVLGLGAGTWYFTVFAVDGAGNESAAGYEISKTINP